MATTYNKPPVGSAWGESGANPADIITMTDADVKAGWLLTGIPPSRQRFNFLINWCFNGIRYFMQRGLVDYDATELYRTGSRCIGDDGNTYQSLVDTNTGHTPSTSPTQWVLWGLNLSQINASQLTQADIASGDASTKVANTDFVQAAITQLQANCLVSAGFLTVGAMKYMIYRYADNDGHPFEIAIGVGTIANGGTVPLPTANFDYTHSTMIATAALIPNGSRTINNLTCNVNASTGFVTVVGTDNGGGSSGGGQATVQATFFRTDADPSTI